MADIRTDAISPYVRQITEPGTLLGAGLTVGNNAVATFETTHYWFPAQYTLAPMPSAGLTPSSQGGYLTFNLPLLVNPLLDVKVVDYDVTLRDVMLAFQAARTDLRLWAYGQWFAKGKLIQVPIDRPDTGELLLTFALEGVRIYKATIVGQSIMDYDGITAVDGLHIPFATDVGSVATLGTHSHLYGNEVLP
ncbi:MAG: hypothetical protein WC381_11830 [Kiritimatiellia bacterium]|jgi:hypothetical protein